MTPTKLIAVATVATGLLLGSPAAVSAQPQPPATTVSHSPTSGTALADRSEFCIQYGFMRVICW